MYDNPDDDELDAASNPFQPEDDPAESDSPLTVHPSTRLVLGINKYSHDVSLCAADASSGWVLFALSKERLTRRKHDGGNAASLVETCLESLDLEVESIDRMVMNNHHHRILPFLESDADNMEWEQGLGINNTIY